MYVRGSGVCGLVVYVRLDFRCVACTWERVLCTSDVHAPMPRPKISEDTIEALDTWIEPNIDVPLDRLSTEDKILILLKNHKKLHEYKLDDRASSELVGIPRPDVDTPGVSDQYQHKIG